MPVQNTCVAPELLTSASSFTCLSSQQLLAVIAYLLSIGSGGGGGVANLHGVVDPNGSVVGTVTAQFYVNTNTGSLWYWDGTLAIWIELIGP